MIDRSLISIKDGGKYALSWLAGTNPKALRSNFKRDIHNVDIPEVCECIMKDIKSSSRRLKFRILFRLCFGTVRIYLEQVQELYNITLELICINTAFMKHNSLDFIGPNSDLIGNERNILSSLRNVNMLSLLKESETFTKYSEETFRFPNQTEMSIGRLQHRQIGVNVEQITIRQVNWTSPQWEKEDDFGEVSVDDISTFLSECENDGLSSLDKGITSGRKRQVDLNSGKKDYSTTKKLRGDLNELDETPIENTIFRRSPSLDDNTNSIHEIQTDAVNITATTENLLNNSSGNRPIYNTCNSQQSVSMRFSKITLDKEAPKSRKRSRGNALIFDTATILPSTLLDTSLKNPWIHCFRRDENEHVMPVSSRKTPFSISNPNLRFQSNKLLYMFKRLSLKQDHDKNKISILRAALGDDFHKYQNARIAQNPAHLSGDIDLDDALPEPTRDNFCYVRTSTPERIDDSLHYLKNNYMYNGQETQDAELETGSLQAQCKLDQIDPFTLNFGFQDASQRDISGMECMMVKLLLSWVVDGPQCQMKSIVADGSRIDAALAFGTLLKLSAQKYIILKKDDRNSIKSIEMGPAIATIINSAYG